MAANLTPQYLEAETEYKKAQTAEERLACLKKMWSLLPKHKASEKLQAELKKKISDTREEVEHQQQKGKKGSFSARVPRQGAGQVILVGGPNTGKSRLLTRLTRATPEVAPYPFTTRKPHVGMMDWEDVPRAADRYSADHRGLPGRLCVEHGAQRRCGPPARGPGR